MREIKKSKERRGGEEEFVNIFQTKGEKRYQTEWRWRDFAKILRWFR